MKIDIFGKEREITLRDCLIVIGEIFLLYGFLKLQVYFDDEANAEGMAKMQAAIPAVVSMDGTESLPEKMKMVSRTRGFYFGRCHINEKASEKDIAQHYKREFQKHGWKYIGRFYWKDAHPHSQADEWYYCFEKGEEYFRNLETKYLRELSQKNGIIISTGGGAVKREENMKILKEKGIVVFLSRKIEDIAKENHEARPLLKDINNIYKLYDERIELYKRYSDIIIENNGTLQEVTDRTAEEIEKIFTK